MNYQPKPEHKFPLGAAYGAAILAGVGIEHWTDVETACDALIQITDAVEPQQNKVEIYRNLYPYYRDLYPRMKSIFESVNEIGL